MVIEAPRCKSSMLKRYLQTPKEGGGGGFRNEKNPWERLLEKQAIRERPVTGDRKKRSCSREVYQPTTSEEMSAILSGRGGVAPLMKTRNAFGPKASLTLAMAPKDSRKPVFLQRNMNNIDSVGELLKIETVCSPSSFGNTQKITGCTRRLNPEHNRHNIDLSRPEILPTQIRTTTCKENRAPPVSLEAGLIPKEGGVAYIGSA